MKAIATIDGHHHIWRLKDLTWLSGPMVPRIFGPYEAVRRDYPIGGESVDFTVTREVYGTGGGNELRG